MLNITRVLRTGLPLPAAGLLLFAFAFSPAPAQQSITQSKHNLAATTDTAGQQVCIACHTPHAPRPAAALWDPRGPGAAFHAYTSSTLQALPGQPTGASKLCLSCHDGTVAPGDLLNTPALHDTHPVSIKYPAAPALAKKNLTPPRSLDSRVQLDDFAQVQCTACHEPHDDQFGSFLVMDNQNAALCRACHDYPYFAATPHATARQAWNGKDANPWPLAPLATSTTVAANACQNCHTPHHADGPRALLTRAPEEEVCLACHNGNVAPFNLAAVFQKPYHHPVERALGVHRDGESPLLKGDHVECADCHNPHRARRAAAVAPNVKGVLEGVSGVDTNGAPVREARYEYQICFKCHAATRRPPLDAVARRTPSFNLLRDFAPSNPSFHPVEAPGRSADVPSLILPLTPASLIYCTDCHNNSQARPSEPGSSGPHGSTFEYLLAARYRTGDSVAESLTAYALCYKCHSRTSILANQSFPLHQLHVVDQRAPCSVCHDSHGIDAGQGNRVNNAHLINFDVSVVTPDTVTRRLEYQSLGVRTGQCFLQCHGVDHSPFTY